MDAFEFLLSKISEEVRIIEEEVSRGKAADFAQYQHLCGKLRGLLVAEDLVKDLQKRMEESDE